MPHLIGAIVAGAASSAGGSAAAGSAAAASAAATGASAAGAAGFGSAVAAGTVVAGSGASATLLGSTTLASLYGTGAAGGAGIISDVSSVAGAANSIAQGSARAGAAKEQAALLDQQAAQTRGAGNVKAIQQAEGARREIAGSTAAYSASGVLPGSGSALATIHENIRQAQANSMYTRMTSNLEATNLTTEAGLERKTASQYQTAGLLGAGTTLLGAYAKSPLLEGY